MRWAHDEFVRDRCEQGFHRHMSNNTGFMNFPIETAAAFPSRTVAAFPLTRTVQPSLDPLTVNDSWASAVAVRPVQQQHQTQVPFWLQLKGTEFWPQTPRSPLGLTGPPPTTLQGMSLAMTGSRHFRRHQHGMQTLLVLAVKTAVDRMPRGLVGMRAEKDTRVVSCHHGILGSRSDTEVGLSGTWSTIETLVTRAQFLATRHQYSCEQTRCQTVQGIAPRNDWS